MYSTVLRPCLPHSQAQARAHPTRTSSLILNKTHPAHECGFVGATKSLNGVVQHQPPGRRVAVLGKGWMGGWAEVHRPDLKLSHAASCGEALRAERSSAFTCRTGILRYLHASQRGVWPPCVIAVAPAARSPHIPIPIARFPRHCRPATGPPPPPPPAAPLPPTHQSAAGGGRQTGHVQCQSGRNTVIAVGTEVACSGGGDGGGRGRGSSVVGPASRCRPSR
mgnify:CR=1 FL=1